jgi:hypothetical protein
MNLRHRSLIAWVALLGILFSQLTLAAYACPMLNPANAPAQMAAHGDMAGMPCAEMDAEQPLLCAQYCHPGQQSVGSGMAFDFHPDLGLLLVVPSPIVPAATGQAYEAAPLLARANAPPPLWRSGRLRI